jgi:hypothetical protein
MRSTCIHIPPREVLLLSCTAPMRSWSIFVCMHPTSGFGSRPICSANFTEFFALDWKNYTSQYTLPWMVSRRCPCKNVSGNLAYCLWNSYIVNQHSNRIIDALYNKWGQRSSYDLITKTWQKIVIVKLKQCITPFSKIQSINCGFEI